MKPMETLSGTFKITSIFCNSEAENFKLWREFNGEDSAPLLDATAAQKALEPAIAKLTNEIFGDGMYDKIQSV